MTWPRVKQLQLEVVESLAFFASSYLEADGFMASYLRQFERQIVARQVRRTYATIPVKYI